MNISHLKAMYVRAGANKLYAKPLAENDNSKNQVYFGPGFHALNLFPSEDIVPDKSVKNPIFKAKLHFGWFLPDGRIAHAPGAQLILYPQYPEVRFSGFLRSCQAAPSGLMASRAEGRILFLGVTPDRDVIGYVVGADSEIAAEFNRLKARVTTGVFVEIGLPAIPCENESRQKLLEELGRIRRLGWIDSKQLDSSGQITPCRAQQCGGFTLEAEMGIPKNSSAEPDYLGWEIKQHAATSISRLSYAGRITLMTPEPTGGFYKNRGVVEFVRKYGYPDKCGRPDRLNFGGIHCVGRRQSTTGLTMKIIGYDETAGIITDVDGEIVLVGDDGEVAASWSFCGLLAHWSRKHMRAAYVPSVVRKIPRWQYSYGSHVRLAQGTDSVRFLAAFSAGAVYYDPGIKLEHVSTAPKEKRRSQFRVALKSIDALYEKVEVVKV